MTVSHGYSTIGGIECGGGCETKKEGDGHIDSAYQKAMEMPINRYQCEWVGIAIQRMHLSYKYVKAQKEN